MPTRLLDILVSLVGLFLLLLMLPVVALLIKLDSPGPVFYAGRRVGKDGRLFRMYKFRTMYETDRPLGASVSPRGDPRITPVGYWLRRLKINEFPQFFNVLKGDMTLVGPRPETPDMAAHYPPEARRIFSVKPGLVGPNQILGRNEEEAYPQGVDPVKFYLEEILPPKLAVDLRYIEEKSFFKDLGYLVRGAWAVVAGAISRQHLTDNMSQLLMLGADTACCLLSFSLAHYLRLGGKASPPVVEAFFHILPLTVLTRIPVLFYFGAYQTLVRYLDLRDLRQVFKGVWWGNVALILVSFFTGAMATPKSGLYNRSIFLIDWFILTFFLVGYRLVLKHFYQKWSRERTVPGPARVALIWGSGEEAIWCLRYLRQSTSPRYEVVGFIDDDLSLQHKRLGGLRVLGDHHHLEILTHLYRVQDLFVALPQVSEGRLQRVQELCQALNLNLLRFVPRTVEAVTLPEAQTPAAAPAALTSAG